MKYSNVLDWLTIFVTVLLIVFGFIMLIAARSKTPMYVVLATALAPVLLGILSTYMKNREIERVLKMIESVGVEAVAAGRREAMISTYVGASGTAVVALIGLVGVAVKRRRMN